MKFINSSIVKNRFTIIELLVVISIIGVLMTLLMPSLKKARESGKISVSLSNIRQIGLAHFMYVDENLGRLVQARMFPNVDVSWDDLLSEMIGTNLTEDEKAGSFFTESRPSLSILHCPSDNVSRPHDRPPRTYELNGSGSLFGTSGNLSMLVSQVSHPSETIGMFENAKSHNWVGFGGNTSAGYGPAEVTTDVSLGGSVLYDPNHHLNNFKNPVWYMDGSSKQTDMRTTLAKNKRLWIPIK